MPCSGALRPGQAPEDTGGIHAATLVEPARQAADAATRLVAPAENIGRNHAVDKSIGGALLAGRKVAGLGLPVADQTFAKLTFKAARADVAWVATHRFPRPSRLRSLAGAGWC